MTTPNVLDELFAEKSATVNHEAERAVIAALMLKPDGKVMVDLEIHPELFTQDATREAYEAICAEILEGIAPDIATLSNALSSAAKIEVETSLSEHASAANLPNWVKRLKACHRARRIQSARNRLVQATNAGVPDHELLAIVESIRQASQDDAKKPHPTFKGLNELLNTPPAENWLVKSWILFDSIIVVFGDSGKGKSFVTIDLLCHIAAGIPWLGSETRKGPVLYIAGEGQNGIIRRFKAWFEHHGHQDAASNILLRTLPAALCDATATAALVEEIAAMPIKPVAIAIDTLARNFGPGDENATRDMNQFVAGLDAIRLATQAALLVPHHSGHAEKTRARGSSVLKAAVDTEFCIEKDGDTVSMSCPKMKDSEAPPPVAWTLTRQALPWCDADGTPMNSAVLVPTEAEQSGTFFKNERLPAAQRIALDALRTALMKEGIEAAGVVSVAEDQWRLASYSAGISASDKPDTAKKAFQRARTELVAAGRVSTQDGRYWMPSLIGTKRDKTGHCPDLYPSKLVGLAGQNGTHSLKSVPYVPPTDTGTAGMERKNPNVPAGDASPDRWEVD